MTRRRVLDFVLALPALVALLALVHPLLPRTANAQPSPTAIIGRIRGTGDRPIDFHAAAFPDSVYVGQQITYQVAVLLSEEARSRLRRNPEFLPPELRGLLSFELGTPTRVAPRNYGGRLTYEAHVFQRALFGVAAGAIRVPAPQLTYSLPQSSSYFSREERFVVRAESALVVIAPLPTENKPADFTGAVGVLRASARTDRATSRVGDPLVLTVRIEGTGNVRLLPRPAVELSWATIVPGSERVQVDTSGSLVRGAKEFDFLVTPTRDGPVTLPVIRYPYFDPYRRSYAVAETSPADVRVAAGDPAAQPVGGEDGEPLALREWPRASPLSIEALPAWLRALVLGLTVVAPLPAIVLILLQKRARRRREQASGTRAMPVAADTPADVSPGAIARRVRRDALSTLASRLHVAPTELVTRDDLEHVLRRRGVTRATTRDLLHWLDRLAMLGFGNADESIAETVSPPSADDSHRENGHANDVASRTAALLARIDAEAVSHGRTRLTRRRGRRSGTGLFALLIALGATAAFSNAAPLEAQTASASCDAASTLVAGARADSGNSGNSALSLAVAEGTAAYRARRFAAAERRFAEAVEQCPRDVGLLVNWGTAAWSASDTVAAVLAWQRAARLDPLAADVQERIALLPAGARTGLAQIPMIPVLALWAVALLCWICGWSCATVAVRRGDPASGFAVAAGVLLVAAIAAGATARYGQDALSPSGLAVVRRPETLRAAPGFDAATAGGLTTGDIVRMSGAQEGWFRVAHTDGREGWMPASRLTPLVGASGIR